nr:retrovirus-related Pol polyprotein from transposon TNT 1-94 [Tanacetum cinerariifolium]
MPQQNGVVEKRNRTLVEAVRTMLTFANLPSFLWAEAIATTCFTQNRLIIHKRFDKTPYELINKRKPNIKFSRVFGCRCYLLNDYEDVRKLKAKGDIEVFVGYSKESAAFRIYNKQTQLLWIFVQDNMSQDVITVGSTMRILLLYRVEYSQCRERFMNYLEEQTDSEAMINSIQNSDQPLPVIAPVNETAKDLWDALERQMRGSEYNKQDRKAAILYEYETFKATEGEQLLDTYLHYLQVINDLKKCGYKKENCELNYKFLNNLQPEWKQYDDVNDALGCMKKAVVVTSDPLALVAEITKITALLAKAFNRRKFYSKPTKNNLRTSSTSQSANKKQKFVKSDDKKVEKKMMKKQDMSKVKCYNCEKEGHFAKDYKKAKVKDYNYYKTKMLLVKKDNDEQVLLAEDQD